MYVYVYTYMYIQLHWRVVMTRRRRKGQDVARETPRPVLRITCLLLRLERRSCTESFIPRFSMSARTLLSQTLRGAPFLLGQFSDVLRSSMLRIFDAEFLLDWSFILG